jgi:hypothetical protein
LVRVEAGLLQRIRAKQHFVCRWHGLASAFLDPPAGDQIGITKEVVHATHVRPGFVVVQALGRERCGFVKASLIGFVNCFIPRFHFSK